MTVVAAVDKDPALVGTDLADLGSSESKSVSVSPSLKHALSQSAADVAVLTAVSDIARIAPQIEEILSHGLLVVTTCEELASPWKTDPQNVSRIDNLAKKKGVTVLLE